MLTIYINYTTEYGEAPVQVSVSIEDETEFTFTEAYLPRLVADGYQFDGWTLDGRLVRAGDISNVISIDTTFELIAHWTVEKNYWGNASGGFGFPKSLVIVDEDGNELTGVVTDEDVVVFDATPADVRINKTFAGENGIQTGENTITYRTTVGYKIVMPGSDFSVNLSDYNGYNYTSFQGLVCLADLTNLNNSVSTTMVSINDGVYEVNSTIKLADVVKNTKAKSVDFNVTNNSDDYYLIYFSTYCQEE